VRRPQTDPRYQTQNTEALQVGYLFGGLLVVGVLILLLGYMMFQVPEYNYSVTPTPTVRKYSGKHRG
jgi:hypothetical protein